MQSFFTQLALGVLGIMPLGMARSLGMVLGYGSWLLNSRASQVTRINLEHCFPEMSKTQLKSLARQSMMQWGISLLEIPLVWGHSQSWLEKKIVGIENEVLFRESLQQKKGLIIIAPHLGNWEAVGLHCARQAALTSMFAPTQSETLNQWVKKSREQSGANLVPTDKRGVMALLKALQNKQTVGILPDQVPARESGDYAVFFGKPALTMTLVHKLIQRSGAKVIFCFAQRVKGGFLIKYIEPPKGLYSMDEKTALASLNEGVQTCVNDALTQYQWEYKRFRRQKNGDEDIYKRTLKS